MVSKRRGKRKSGGNDLVFELSEEDVSSDNSDNECHGSNSKISRPNSNFVNSVVNALSNLENKNEKKISENKTTEESQIQTSTYTGKMENNLEVQEHSITEVQNIVRENVPDLSNNSLLEAIEKAANVDYEEGEIFVDGNDVETSSTQKITIHFSNKEIKKKYMPRFIKFVRSFATLINEDKLSITLDLSTDGTIKDNVDVTDSNKHEVIIKSPKKKKKKKDKKEKELFVLDTTPSDHRNPNWIKYTSAFTIDVNQSNDEEGESKGLRVQMCFNCNGTHSLRDCPHPKDHNTINRNRQKFKKDKQTIRYHLDEEQKYAHLAPGIISNNLREALGLSKHEIPPYVYQMRLYGYPPGWLEEAKTVHSNLELYDAEGNPVKPANLEKKLGLDSSKIVNYPGFNVALGKNSKDDYKYYRVPPYSEIFSKQAMIDYYESMYAKEQDDLRLKDMDLETDGSKDSKDSFVGKLATTKRTDNDVPSPSLVDLENEKKTLLAALNDSPQSALQSEENTCDTQHSEKDSKLPLEQHISVAEDQEVHLESAEIAMQEIFTEQRMNERKTDHETTFTESTAQIIKTTLGTPILKSTSRYTHLPHPDNFMKGVSPVINFENLPNSTGSYEKLSGILSKVRNTMKNLQDRKDCS